MLKIVRPVSFVLLSAAFFPALVRLKIQIYYRNFAVEF